VPTVSIVSEPDGAEVLLDGVMVGNTPVQLPRPATGTQTVTLRLRGHQESTVQISPQTGDTVSLTLEPTPAPSSGRRRPLPQPVVGPIGPPPSLPPSHPPPPIRPRTSEVVDPWAQ
jgi:hypothetical protein